MTPAEFFLRIGIKGNEDTAKALTNVRGGLLEVKSTGLAAKAAIVGVVYGVERLISGSANFGASMVNFGTYTGASTEKLQQWQEAFRRTNSAAEEVIPTFNAVQSAMTDMLMGKGAPQYMGLIGLDYSKIRDTFYVMDKLREFAAKHKDNPDFANKVLGSFGVGPGFINTARRYEGDIYKIREGVMSAAEAKNLARIEANWSRFWKGLSRLRDEFVSQHGGSIVGMLGKDLKILNDMIKAVRGLTNDFPQLGEAMKLAFVGITAMLAPWTALATMLVWLLSEVQKYREGNKPGNESIFGYDGKTPKSFDWGRSALDWITYADPKKALGDWYDSLKRVIQSGSSNTGREVVAQLPNIFQTNNINGVPGAEDSTGAIKEQTKAAVKQSQAAIQGN